MVSRLQFSCINTGGTSRDSAPQQSSETDQEEAADQGMDMDGVAVTEGESQEEHLHSPLVHV